MTKEPVDVLCIYRVKDGKDGEFRKLLAKHGPALKAAGLAGARTEVDGDAAPAESACRGHQALDVDGVGAALQAVEDQKSGRIGSPVHVVHAEPADLAAAAVTRALWACWAVSAFGPIRAF